MTGIVERTRWWVDDIQRKGSVEADEDREAWRADGFGVGYKPEAVEIPEELVIN